VIGHLEAVRDGVSRLGLDEVSRAYVALVAERENPGWFRRRITNSAFGDLLDDRMLGRFQALEEHLTGIAIGATPGRWGVLSGDETHHIEGALERLGEVLVRRRAVGGMRDDAERVRECLSVAKRIRGGVALVRALAHLGDDEAREALTWDVAMLVQELISLSDDDGYGPVRDAGIESFLPLERRRQVSRLSEVVARNRPVRLAVGPDGDDLGLGQILVPESLRGQGLGNVALKDLCGFADRGVHAITGCFDPGEGAEEWLAKWYEGHGFRPVRGGWRRGCKILRPASPVV
jgi:hypothetical protein